MSDLEYICNANNLIQSFNKCKKGVSWKASVQDYEINLLRNIRNTQKKILEDGDFSQSKFYEFILQERGKVRDIKAVPIFDRVLVNAYCNLVLLPAVQKYLIYDNGASLKGKGIHFTRERLYCHLQRFYREENNNEGYVLLIDFSKFFDNIRHEQLFKDFYEKRIKDISTIDLFNNILKMFEVDVSDMSEQEYNNCLNVLFDSVAYLHCAHKATGERFMKKSIGIGSQLSQIAGLLYPTEIDTYCKTVKGLKYYGRYMDDIYIIHKDKEYLKQLLLEITEIAKKRGLFINQKKTQIVKLSRGFTFLKIQHFLTNSGKVIRKIDKKSVTRQRRKLKKFRIKLNEGKMSFLDVYNAYYSWRGGVEHYNSYQQLQSMDKLFEELYSQELKEFQNDRHRT